MTSAFFDSSVLFAASDAGIFGKLANLGASDSATLAAALALDPRGARLLLDACVAVGLLDKVGDRYQNTPESSMFLVPGSPADLSNAIRYNRDVYPAWGRLIEFARKGQPVESPQLHLGSDADRTRTFVLSMHHRAMAMGRAVVPMLQLNGARQLLDVGGGPGTYSVLIAQTNPGIHCTVLDLPPVAQIASELIAQQGYTDRVQTLPGSYHSTPFPAGMDVVNFFGMLHQESPEAIVSLFRKGFDALVPGGTVYVMDMMTDKTHAAPKYSALFAVNMALTTNNGWVFSDAELLEWFAEAGFVNGEVQPLPAPMPHWLARAHKPA